MDPLRIVLFLGLVAHKFLWEYLKRRSGALRSRSAAEGLTAKWLIKPVKMLVLGFILIQTLFLDLLPIAQDPFFLRLFGAILYVVGLGTAVLARIQLGDNWIDLEDYQVLPEQSVTTRGIYRYIRHPIYSGDILLVAGLQLALNSWFVVMVLPLLFVTVKQALAEEVLLARVFPDYKAYCGRTKRFIPFIA